MLHGRIASWRSDCRAKPTKRGQTPTKLALDSLEFVSDRDSSNRQFLSPILIDVARQNGAAGDGIGLPRCETIPLGCFVKNRLSKFVSLVESEGERSPGCRICHVFSY